MTTISLNWTGVPDTNPISPSSGFTSLGAGTAKVTSQVWSGNSASINTVWGCDTVPSSDTFTSSFVMGPSDSNGRGLGIYNASGNGFMFLARSTDIRVFALASYVLSGSVLATYTLSVAVDKVIDVDVTQSTGTYVVKYDGSTVGTYVNALYTSGLRTGPLSRSGGIKSFALTYTPAQSIDTFTDPIIPGAAASGTQTGYVDGAITADFGGIAFTGTVSGSSLSGTVSSFVDGGLCPLLPAASVSGTFTQGGNTANLTRAVSVPTGLQELRDGGGNPANFSGIVLGDPKYIGQSFADAGNPLTTLDRSYVDPSYGLTIDQDGRVRLNAPDHPTDPVTSLPYTTTLWIRRGADGKAYGHTLTIDEEGNVSTGGLSVAGLSNSGLSNAGLSVSGL